MSWRSLLLRVGIPALAALLLLGAWQSWGWPGVAAVSGGLVMWAMLHFTRTMQVLQRAANRPIGYVDSAVMLNARLQAGHSLLQVVGLTQALGQLQSAPQAQPEVYRWSDPGGSYVECEFAQGRLLRWQMQRPDAPSAP